MKQRNFLLAWLSLCLKFLKAHFSTKIIIKAFVGAILISNFILCGLLNNEILNFISPFLTLAGLCVIIKSSRAGYFASGFFTGILWFYWISFSFIYYELGWLIPFIILIIALIYGVVFWLASFPSFIPLRGIALFLASYIHPFGFNWLNLEATLVFGEFDPSVRGLIALFLAAIAITGLQTKLKFALAAVCLLSGAQISNSEPKFLPFQVELVQTDVPQALKWNKQMKKRYIDENLALIDGAIGRNMRAIIMPESAFPVFMTHERELQDELKRKSREIAVIAGALAFENGKNFNSTFVFDKGEMKRIDKMILVPFGEEVPLPNFIKGAINKLFFDGAMDYAAAKAPSDYEIDGVKIRNAICYEATRDELFAGEFDAMIAVTNNGWFVPSAEPVLQRILLKYYASKYNKVIYHSANGSPSEIITPKRGLAAKFIKTLGE